MSQINMAYIEQFQACLCPPGNGVFTVNTAKERKAVLHQALFQETELTYVEQIWQQQLPKLADSGNAVILGIASDCGGGILRGANWGPLFLRTHLVEQYGYDQYFDLGDVRVIPHLLHDKYLNTATINNCKKALYGDTDNDYAVSPLTITEDIATSFYDQFPGKGLFGIGGDHSISYALTKPYLQAKKHKVRKLR